MERRAANIVAEEQARLKEDTAGDFSAHLDGNMAEFGVSTAFTNSTGVAALDSFSKLSGGCKNGTITSPIPD